LGNGTHYISNGGTGGQSWTQYFCTRPTLVRGIYARVAVFQNALNNQVVLTVLKNGVATSTTVTVGGAISLSPATASAATVSTDFAVNDLIAVQAVVSGGNANGLTVVVDAY
jgi:hypothetical protein